MIAGVSIKIFKDFFPVTIYGSFLGLAVISSISCHSIYVQRMQDDRFLYTCSAELPRDAISHSSFRIEKQESKNAKTWPEPDKSNKTRIKHCSHIPKKNPKPQKKKSKGQMQHQPESWIKIEYICLSHNKRRRKA